MKRGLILAVLLFLLMTTLLNACILYDPFCGFSWPWFVKVHKPQPPKDPIMELLEREDAHSQGVIPGWYEMQLSDGVMIYYPFVLRLIPKYCIFTFYYYGTYHLRIYNIKGYTRISNGKSKMLIKFRGVMWDKKMHVKYWLRPEERTFPQIIVFPRYRKFWCPTAVEFEYDVYKCELLPQERYKCHKMNAISQKLFLYFNAPKGRPVQEISYHR